MVFAKSSKNYSTVCYSGCSLPQFLTSVSPLLLAQRGEGLNSPVDSEYRGPTGEVCQQPPRSSLLGLAWSPGWTGTVQGDLSSLTIWTWARQTGFAGPLDLGFQRRGERWGWRGGEPVCLSLGHGKPAAAREPVGQTSKIKHPATTIKFRDESTN